MYFNRIILVGRLTRDPELRSTPDGIPLVRFTLAVDRGRGGEERVTDFLDVVAFRQLAETVANYMTKGRLVLVEGRLQTRSYTDREGIRRKAFEVFADTVRFLERAPQAEVSEEAPPQPQVATASRPAPAPVPVEPEGSYDDIEFPVDEDFDLESPDLDEEEGDPFR